MKPSLFSHPAYWINKESENEFTFTTAQGAEYTVYFTEGDGYAPEASFAQHINLFGFARTKRRNMSRPKIGHDERIMPTVAEVLHQRLQLNPETVIVYVCSNDGGMQRHRSELFTPWFAHWQRESDAPITKIDYSFYNQLYCTCLFRADHPDRVEIQSVILRTVEEKQ